MTDEESAGGHEIRLMENPDHHERLCCGCEFSGFGDDLYDRCFHPLQITEKDKCGSINKRTGSPNRHVCDLWERKHYYDYQVNDAEIYTLLRKGLTNTAMRKIEDRFGGIPTDLIDAKESDVRKTKGHWSFDKWVSE